MSCYFRHMDEIFALAGISVASQNRKQLDETIHKLMGIHYKDCPATWREFKKQVLVDDESRRKFAQRLKESFTSKAS
jgi:hypothetical protein